MSESSWKSAGERLFDLVPDTILLVDDKGMVRDANAAVAELFGYSQAELIGQSMSILLPPALRERHEAMVQAFWSWPLTRRMGTRSGIVGQHKDGREIPLDVKLALVDDGDRRFIAAVIRDISHLHEAQMRVQSQARMLERLNTELQESLEEVRAKNKALAELDARKNQLLGVAAHDLRNPLAGIRGSAELLDLGVLGEVSDQQRIATARILYSSDYMLKLVEGLLDLAAVESGVLNLDKQPTDFAALTREIVELERVIAKARRIAIAMEDEGAPTPVLVDPFKMEQVVRNLVDNAVKYSPADSEVHVRLYGDRRQLRVEVADEGPGMSSEEVRQLFQPFRRGAQGKQSGVRGAGLGLAIVHRIVKGHHGEIEVFSELGRGTVFQVQLPVA